MEVETSTVIRKKNQMVFSEAHPQTNGLYVLRELLESYGLLSHSHLDVDKHYRNAICNTEVQRMLDWDLPEITDLSDILMIKNCGRVSAIRMDRLKGVGNLKKHVIAGILLREVIRGKLPKPNVDTLVDSGNMNTGFSLRYYCKLLNMRGLYIMSRYFPKKMVRLLEENNFEVIQAPKNESLSLEEEFYRYLYNRIRTREFRKNKRCLWHAKYGGVVLYPLGENIARDMDRCPDYIVLSVGSGATLSCMVAIQDYFKEVAGKCPSIVIAEHEKSPIYAKRCRTIISDGISKKIDGSFCAASFRPSDYRISDERRIPHYVIGPHYEKRNPLLSERIEERISDVLLYKDLEWMKMSHYLESCGIGVGNSSAAHLSIATNLANEGYDVLTVIMEPMRSYYKSQT